MNAPEDCLALLQLQGPSFQTPPVHIISMFKIRKLFSDQCLPVCCPESIPEDMDARLHLLAELSQVRIEIDNSDSRCLATHPSSRDYDPGLMYYCGLVERFRERVFPAGRQNHVRGALESDRWDEVPVHRVVDKGGGSCLSSLDQAPVVDEEESGESLVQEGLRSDENCKAMGGAFRFFEELGDYLVGVVMLCCTYRSSWKHKEFTIRLCTSSGLLSSTLSQLLDQCSDKIGHHK